MNIKILGITGKKRAGKGAAAAVAQACNYEQIDFADPIRACAMSLFDYTPRQLDAMKEDIHPVLGISPREFMQKLGTEFGRDMIDPDLWVKSVQNKIMSNRTRDIVISDVRFPNEAAMVKKFQGRILKVTRPNADGDNHSSENHEIKADYEIANDGQLHEFHKKVQSLLDYLYEE